MRDLIGHFLQGPGGTKGPTIRIAGLEKSGAFVEHAAEISQHLDPSSYLVVGDRYIRKHVEPGAAEIAYGSNTYYGQKVLFKALSGEMHVVTIPAVTYLGEPRASDIPHLEVILALIAELRCSMYDNSLIPIALANKLVSLSDFPSQRILTTFARDAVK